MHHLGAERSEFQHFLEGDLVEPLGARHDARIGRIDAIDVRVDVAAVSADGRRDRHCRSIRPAAAQSGDAAGLLVHALEAGDDRNLFAFRKAADQLLAIDVEDARRAVDVRGRNRKLPALPGARVDIEVLQRDRHQAGGHLLSGRDHGIVFARIENAPRLERGLAPGHELIGHARHGRRHDRNLMPGIDLALDVTRGVADAVDVGDRRAAEFHDQTGHEGALALSIFLKVDARPQPSSRGETARIDNGEVRQPQYDCAGARFVRPRSAVIETGPNNRANCCICRPSI